MIKLFVVDLDGVLYVGDTVIAGAVELVKCLQSKYNVVFYSNTSGKNREQVSIKLRKMGFKCDYNNVYTSGYLTALFLKENNIDNVFIIGNDNLIEEIENKDISVEGCENVVVGFDEFFDYDKISTALNILLTGGLFIACNEDQNFPIEHNRIMPGCGAMVGAIIGSFGRRPDFIVGKPNIYGLEKICKDFNVTNKEIIVIGDSLDSDIKMANSYKCESALIGKCNCKNESNPTYAFDNMNDFLKFVREVF